MGHSRPRYNEKGRATAADATRKRPRAIFDDSNAEIIDPVERKKAKAAQEENAPKPEEKMSKKKRKRFEAYVAKKLKKEERKGILASLEKTQIQNLDLKSSSKLGTGKLITQREQLAQSEKVEQGRRSRAVGILKSKIGMGNHSDSEMSDIESEEELSDTPTIPKPKPAIIEAFDSGVVTLNTKEEPARVKPAVQAPTVGAGLAKNAVVKVVSRTRKETTLFRRKQPSKKTESDFDSSASDDESGTDSASEEAEEWNGIADDATNGINHDDTVAGEVEGSEESEENTDGDELEVEGEEDSDQGGKPVTRTKGAFKSWADSQLNQIMGVSEGKEVAEASNDSVYDPYKPLLPSGSGERAKSYPEGLSGPLGEHLAKNEVSTIPAQPTTNVVFTRTEEIQLVRNELPIVKEEDKIMEAIKGHAVVVLCGETGSGKTTQIGQFLLENGWGDTSSDNPGLIAVTQPRRVAALSTSVRVKTELCLPTSSKLVGHRIRYSTNTSDATRLIFMTDGVLLRALAEDFLLSTYSAVVIDEAHERGVNTDILIGVLSRVARLRQEMWIKSPSKHKPLRLIIMSATLRVSDFAENPTLFSTPPPIVHVAARQHPVTVHYTRKTSPDYIVEAFKKAARIHTRLPDGGILIFLTGQNEITSLKKKLEKKYGEKAIKERKERRERMAATLRNQSREDESEDEKLEEVWKGRAEVGETFETEELDLGTKRVDLEDIIEEERGAVLEDPEDLESSDEDDDLKISEEADCDVPVHVLPLYSLLPTEQQMKVFEAPPEGKRLVVISTNIAETAITIPNIKYVIDTGRSKERQYDQTTGVQSFQIDWISKASAAQRAGRAGRTGPGHCYRLYSSALYENHFEAFSKPEILRMPIEGVVLQMKNINIDTVINFPFPTPPDRDALRFAEKTLTQLGALENGKTAKITELGKSMAHFPLSPRFAKMLVSGQQAGCLPYVIAMVCALTVGDPFIREAHVGQDDEDKNKEDNEKVLTATEIQYIRNPELRAKEESKLARKKFFQTMQKYNALGKGTSDVFKILSVVGAYEYDGGRASFCEDNFVRIKAMEEIHKLRSQISSLVQSLYPGVDAGFVPKLDPPTDKQLKILRQLMASTYLDQIAIRSDLVPGNIGSSFAKLPSTRGVPYTIPGITEQVYIHPTSSLFHSSPPEYVVYQEVEKTERRTWLKMLTVINAAWLPVLAKPLCTFSKPLENATLIPATNQESAAEKEVIVVPKFHGIQLKPIKVTMKLVNGKWIYT